MVVHAWCVQNENGDLIGVDDNSGGYPWNPFESARRSGWDVGVYVGNVRFFPSLAAAEKYCRHDFSNIVGKLVPVQVTISWESST